MWGWRQSQAVDERRGIRPARGVEVRVLVQVWRVPREGAVEPGALEVCVVRLAAGGRRGGGGGWGADA